MADRSVDYLLIGGGVAAATCARRLRREGADGSILMVGREADPPYDRPPLSKGYLAGEKSREDVLLEAPEWWAEHGVELLTRTSVMKLDPEERVARLSTREDVRFDRALLATGANVRRLRAEGSDLDGIHYLRSFANADAIRADAESAEQVVLIGGSYIGCEVAATLTEMGRRCTIVMMESVALEASLGRRVAGFIHRLLEEHGVAVRGEEQLERFEGAEGRVSAVVTSSEQRLPCQCVVIGAGVTPDVMLARGAGLDVGERGGVRCSAGLETSTPGVYAAGDMAEWDFPLAGRPVRIEHWDVAAEHGKTAALNMLGRGVEHEAVPYFWSDLADWASIEYVGVGGGEDPVIRGSLDDGAFTAFYRDGQRVTAAATVGRSDDLAHARRLIAERAEPGVGELADEGTDLADL